MRVRGRSVGKRPPGGTPTLAIAGAGVAGAYLGALLATRGVDVELFDPAAHGTDCGLSPCGWGVPSRTGPYLEAVGLSLDDYVLASMENLTVGGLRARTSLLTLDKPRLVRDLARFNRVHRRSVGPELIEGYDLVIDATGLARALLPPCRSDLLLSTAQCRITADPGEGRRLAPAVEGGVVPGFGYTWLFPLGGDQYHLGAGVVGPVDPEGLLQRALLGLTRGARLVRHCVCRGAVRVSSPHQATPFYTESGRKGGTRRIIVGVGESIGAVGPFTGEGILPSLECARLLAAHLDDPEGYTRAVLRHFGWMKGERKTLDRLLAPAGAANLGLHDRWRFYRNARRSGIRLPLGEAVRRSGRLSEWVDGPAP
ncbi:MAG TPA: hypothetical protein PLY91_01155 [Methanoregulaceae archaeon]|nr:hypothetical protein [Methanoregulaceae archaeon]